MAQLVVETVTKKSITELMHDRLFEPLHMTRTSMIWRPGFETDYANGYNEQGKSLGPQRRKTGDAAAGMQTTLRDCARFVQAVLNGAILDRDLREIMLSPQIQIFLAHEFPSLAAETNATADRAIRLSYGLRWGLFWTPYGKAFFKEGHDEGWRHYLVCFDKPKDGMLIMTNSSNGGTSTMPCCARCFATRSLLSTGKASAPRTHALRFPAQTPVDSRQRMQTTNCHGSWPAG